MRPPNLQWLVRIRPQSDTTYISQSRTVFATSRDGMVHEHHHGVIMGETRLLSRWQYKIAGEKPMSVALSNVEQHTFLGYYVVLPPGFNAGEQDHGSGHMEQRSQQSLELRVARYVGSGIHEDLDLTNYSNQATDFEFCIEFASDFSDVADLEADRRPHYGELKRSVEQGDNSLTVHFHYHVERDYRHQGSTGHGVVDRSCSVEFFNCGSAPKAGKDSVSFQVHLEPRESWHTCVAVGAKFESIDFPAVRECVVFFDEKTDWDHERNRFLEAATHFTAPAAETLTKNVIGTIEQAKRDLAALRLHDLDHAPNAWIPAAGLPIYLALFGRDTLAAGWQSSLMGADIMRGTLPEMGKWQGYAVDDWRDEQPGRMLHEAHLGPRSVLGFNPRTRYYGANTTSSTYPALVCELWHWTADKETIRPLVPFALDALRWLEEWCHKDDDPFYEYQTYSKHGTTNQGWKDSGDAIVYPDGTQVKAPIATCEEQAFLYGSKLGFSEVLWWLDEKEDALRLYREAQDFKKLFNEKFWMEEEGIFAMGLDSFKQPIRTVASNAGHCLVSGIADSALVERCADRLFQPDMFSGWGVRTLSSNNPFFNPYSYHRGSIWPVEHGPFSMGFMRYGLIEHMHRICKAMFEAAGLFDFYRLPEVFSGHHRDDRNPFPAIYPKANWPQAWSASSVIQLVQAMLGLYPYAPLNVLIVDPHLPEWLPEISLHKLSVGRSEADIRFFRKADGSSDYELLDVRGPLHVFRQASPWSLKEHFSDRIVDIISSFLPGKVA